MEGTKFAGISGDYSTQFLGSWKLISQNIEKNSSLIRLYGTFRYGGGISVASTYSAFKVNGVAVKTGEYRYYPGDTQLGYTDLTVAHNADGSFPSRTVSISASSYHMSGSASGTISGVPSIPRASSIDASDFYLGTNPSFTIKRASSSFSHYVSLYCGDTWISGVSVPASDTSGAVSLSAEQTGSLYSRIPEKTSLSVHLLCTTYNGQGVQIGEPVKKYVWALMQESSAKPVFTDFDFADANPSVTGVTGDNQLLVEGQSTLEVTVPAAKRAIARHGSSIKKYILTCGGQVKEASYSDSLARTLTIPKVSSGAITVTAVDSRGLKTSVTKNASFQSYAPPVIKEARALRKNGVEAETTLTLRIQISSGSLGDTANSVTSVSYRYKPAASDAYVAGTTPITPGTSVSTVIAGDLAEGFTVASDYDLEVTVHDAITSSSILLRVGSGVPVIDMYRKEDAVGISVGSLYDEQAGGLLQMAGTPLLQSGTSETGGWIQFYDGTMICRQTYHRSMPRSSWVDWYGHLACDLGSPPDFPKEFLEAPLCWYTLSGTWATICTLQTLAGSKATASKSDVLMIVRPPDSIASNSTVDVDVQVLAIGRWK